MSDWEFKAIQMAPEPDLLAPHCPVPVFSRVWSSLQESGHKKALHCSTSAQSMHIKELKIFTGLYMSLSDQKSASNIDFGITNKLANAKFRIVNNEYQLSHVYKGQNCHDYLDRCRKSI